jgi:tetratricopeptide (TPR) repeat protein
MMNRREQGNQAFKQGRYQEAIDRYTEALDELQSTNSDKNDLTKCFSNRAQCHLNLQQYEETIDDATRALEFVPSDQKSLYRRSIAFEKLGKINEAISDAQRLISVLPKENSVDEQTTQLLRRLRENAQNKVTKTSSFSTKFFNVFLFCFSTSNKRN